jgi:scyllo-inositol 2-dehydrogenase (NADP+)
VKVGFIGFGRQAELHAKAMAAMPDLFQLTHVTDVTPSRLAAAHADFGVQADQDIARLLESDTELVFITTNSSSHHALALQVAQAHKHMVVEKPLCQTSVDAAEMVDVARRHDVLLSCFHNRRWDDDVRRVRRAVVEGRIGEPFLVENRTAADRPAVGAGAPEFNQQWRVTRAMGGGTVYDFGPHWIDQVFSIVPGKVLQVFADVRHFRWGDADDYFDIKLVFDNGCRATVSKCDIAHVAWPKWMVFGTTGGIKYEKDRCLVRTGDGEFVQEEGDPVVNLYQNFHDAVRLGAPLAVTGEQAKRNIDVIDAAFRSAALGRSVDVSI